MASWPMRNIKTFPSKQMYLYFSLVGRKEAEFYYNIDRRSWVKMTYFHRFFGTIPGVLAGEDSDLTKTMTTMTERSAWLTIIAIIITMKRTTMTLDAWYNCRRGR